MKSKNKCIYITLYKYIQDWQGPRTPPLMEADLTAPGISEVASQLRCRASDTVPDHSWQRDRLPPWVPTHGDYGNDPFAVQQNFELRPDLRTDCGVW